MALFFLCAKARLRETLVIFPSEESQWGGEAAKVRSLVDGSDRVDLFLLLGGRWEGGGACGPVMAGHSVYWR